jgi:putative ubiquitin-RnfH superfamily antitoxin RatB of RatAB toxin-antitoxin module
MPYTIINFIQASHSDSDRTEIRRQFFDEVKKARHKRAGVGSAGSETKSPGRI